MILEPLRLRGVTNSNRYEIIDHAVNCINQSRGWVTNHAMYSDTIIVINFDIQIKGVINLIKLLNSNGLHLMKENVDSINNLENEILKNNLEDEIIGSIQITFIK
ncbi:hypothetical protein [Bacillus sp. E(2018)]|uniref:hypothetical protein n=1 Tax=Bacillus sp. E(2018) TaxID=2502239 RepID=UPI0010F67BB3|nr:hypothetical protein [Bacillus sp. E(2018)]